MLTPITNVIEKDMLDKITKCERQLGEAIFEAAEYLCSAGRHKFAYQLLVRFAGFTMDQEKVAFIWLTAGQVAEQAGEFDVAADIYRSGLKNKISDGDTAYLLNNNLGYSLIQIGMYGEAEGYCKEAISIDSTRYNAYKNLGLALNGQGKYLEAAISLQKASLMSKDPRAKGFSVLIQKSKTPLGR